jgi:hypothetical protein
MVPNDELYQPNSPILILTIDSFHKIKGGIPEYHENLSFFSELVTQKNKDFFQDSRRKIFNHLKNKEVIWHGCEKEHEDNENLVLGKDFFGNDRNATYLSAIKRYEGPLYDGLGEKGIDYLLNSRHHFLILSGLYGFLKPFEPIQFYSCQFGEKNICYDIWTNQNGISNVLIDYIKKYKISKIFDFTACDVTAYHECLDWDYITKETNSEILHAYHVKTTTDKALKYFGRFIRNHLLLKDSEYLLKINSGSIMDEIEFVEKLKCINQKITDDEKFRNLLAIGENESIEFKSSALWSKSFTEKEIQASPERDIKKYGRNASKVIIAKTIAGFLNADGGHLIIGIKENKNGDKDEIIGIEGEYDKLEDPCPDGYRRMIVDEIIKYFLNPEIFHNFAKYVNISFQKVNNKTLCWLQIKKSDIPVFVNSNREDCFYKRIDSETRQIVGKQLSDYILTRFR